MHTLKKAKALGLIALTIMALHGAALNSYTGKFTVFNKEPYPVVIEDIEWSNCRDDSNITIQAYGKWEDSWSPFIDPKCKLKKIRVRIQDQNNFTYQNLYHNELVPYGGVIECTINRNTQLPGGQEEPIVCYKSYISRAGYYQAFKLLPKGHWK